MAARFAPGSTVYAKDGRSYVVEIVDGGTVYCKSTGGTEMEFPAAVLMTADEWAARSDGRRDASMAHLKQSRVYSTVAPKLDRAACEVMLAKADKLSAGLLDFAAFNVAAGILTENHDAELIDKLSIVKCRQLFDAAKPEAQATMLANVLHTVPDRLTEAARLGDNLMRAMIQDGLANQSEAYEDFLDRPRR